MDKLLSVIVNASYKISGLRVIMTSVICLLLHDCTFLGRWFEFSHLHCLGPFLLMHQLLFILFLGALSDINFFMGSGSNLKLSSY